MSSAGMLDPDNVLFYHPLESDKIEVVGNQEWLGAASFTPAKIDDGIFGISQNTISFFDTSLFREGELPQDITFRFKAVKIDDDTILATFSTITTFSLFAVAGHVHDNDVIWGEPVLIKQSFPEYAGLCSLGRDRVGVVTWWDTSTSAFGKVITISGDNTVIVSDDDFEYDTGITTNHQDVCAFDENTVIVVYKTGAGSPAPSEAKSKVGIVSGSGTSATIDWGTKDVYEANFCRYNNVAKISDTQVAVSYIRFAGVGVDENLYVQVGIVDPSGQSISWGSQYQIVGDINNGSNEIIVHKIDTTDVSRIVFGVVYRDVDNDGVFAQLASVPSTGSVVVTLPFNLNITTVTNGTPEFGVARLSNNTYTVGYIDTSNDGICSIIKFIAGANANLDTIETVVEFNMNFDPGSVSVPWLMEFDLNRIGVAFRDINSSDRGRFAFGEFSPQGGELDGTGYDSIANATRIVAVAWMNNPSFNGSQTIIDPFSITIGGAIGPPEERARDIYISSSGITDTFSTPELSGVIDALNDDTPHFVVLDFENVGQWSLKVSVDGQPFLDVGSPVSSVTGLTIEQPGIKLETDEDNATQWIDELAVWSGYVINFDSFTDQELENLYNLGATFDAQLNEYTDFFEVSTLINNSLLLFIDGGAPSETSDLPLFIYGLESTTNDLLLFIEGEEVFTSTISNDLLLFMFGSMIIDDNELDNEKSINTLIKHIDYDPILIGNFDPLTSSSATIVIWNLINNNNTSIALLDNDCFAIGNTGTFGWSLENMPSNFIKNGHFLFEMTANNGQIFVQEFKLLVKGKGGKNE